MTATIKFIVTILLVILLFYICFQDPTPFIKCPILVNYHFTHQPNENCGLCFHTATTYHRQDLGLAQRGLRLLQEAGMRKLNFAGGEPFLHPKFLGQLIDYCKRDLCLESVSIVSNGSLITQEFLAKHGHNIDTLTISCDSFNEETNIAIGRGSGDQVVKLYMIASWCRKYGIKFKIITVVCQSNVHEDMNAHIATLQPFRWNCFRISMFEGENNSKERSRDVRRYEITHDDYEDFCKRHKQQPALFPESGILLAKSYMILDESMRFLNRHGRHPSPSILKVGVQKALSCVLGIDESSEERGGIFDWQRLTEGNCAVWEDIDW